MRAAVLVEDLAVGSQELRAAVLYPLEFAHRAFVGNIAGIQGSGGFKEQQPAFLVRHRLMLDAAWNNDELAFFDPLVTVAEFHPEPSFHNKKHFIFVFVMVKDELALELVELYVLSVELGADVGLPVFGDLREFFGDVHFGHWGPL